MLTTPLEAAGHTRLSRPEEIAAYLARLAAGTRGAQLWSLGHSAGGRPLSALHLPACAGATPPLRVLLVGSQHGASEAAGGEALLVLARELAARGSGGPWDGLEVLICPDANPDGRALDSARNAEDVNINLDFVLLTQPETRALDTLLREFAPDVVLDAHESAVLKHKTLAREGYMTDFETQFDCANNPAIPAALRAYAEQQLLPTLVARVAAQGIAAQRYIREILSLSQVATHGGLTAHKFRNRAGLSGALAFLLETRMDPKAGSYPSFRNIAVRSAKQLLAQRVFLDTVAERHAELKTLLAAQRHSEEPLVVEARYASRGPGQVLHLPMRSISDGQLREFAFADHRAVVCGPALTPPRAYWFNDHHETFMRLLDNHGFAYEQVTSASRCVLRVQPLSAPQEQWPPPQRLTRELPVGSVRVAVGGPRGRLLSVLLEARSNSSVFRHESFARLLSPGGECCVLAEEA